MPLRRAFLQEGEPEEPDIACVIDRDCVARNEENTRREDEI